MSQGEKFEWAKLWKPLHIWTIAVIFILDQLTKYLVIWLMPLGKVIPVFAFFDFVHIKNRGAAFGIFHDSSPLFRALFFGIVTIVCVWLLLNWLGATPLKDRLQRFGLCLILGGALGNVKDRIVFGEVTDFIHFYYQSFSWPAFNIADAAISIGVALILFQMLQERLSKRAKRVRP